jgi:signal transduction histidine kinase
MVNVLIVILILIIFLIRQSKKNKYKTDQLNIQNKKIKELMIFLNQLQNMIVHDLKNPLSNILTKSKDKSITHSAKTMLNLVQNILDLSKYEETNINLKKTSFSLNKILLDILLELEYATDLKNISISIPNNDFALFADKDLITRVLMNLLNNAVRFSPVSSTIKVSAEIKANDEILISVENTGEKIDEKVLSSIFDRYFQSEVINSLGYKTTGIGLSFCKLVIEAHNKKIWVENSDKSVIFKFTVSGKKDEKIITKTEFIKKNTFNFSVKELKSIKQYINMLSGYKIYQISEIFDILNQIPDISQNIIAWKWQIKTAVYSSNQELFEELLAI